MKLLLLLAMFSAEYRWVKVKPTSYQVDERYVNFYGNVMGGYYQPHEPTHQAVKVANPFTASCWDGAPVEMASEEAARAFVMACPKY